MQFRWLAASFAFLIAGCGEADSELNFPQEEVVWVSAPEKSLISTDVLAKRKDALPGEEPDWSVTIRCWPRGGAYDCISVSKNQSSSGSMYSLTRDRRGQDMEVELQMAFALSQTIRRTRHQQTEEELRRQEQWDRRHANNWGSGRNRPTVPHYDFTPTGEMSLEISGWPRPDGVTHKFADSRSRKIEERIPEIFASMAAHAAYQLEWRLEQEARRRRAEEEQARRDREEHERQLEQQRVQFLGRVLMLLIPA